MKKLLLLSAVLLGAATASQAGVRFNLGIGIPLPPPPTVVVAPPTYVAPAPTYVEPAPPVCEPAQQVYAPAPFVVAPQVVLRPPVIDFRVRHEPYWQHFRGDFRRAHDHDRDWHRGYDRDHGRRW
jgi:hypothetical protein